MKLDYKSTNDMQRIRNLGTPKHDSRTVEIWVKKVVRPGIYTSSESYYADVWARFTNFAQEVIKNKDEGPFCLYKYVTKQDEGLLHEMRKTLEQWKTEHHKARSAIGDRSKDCEKLYNAFKNPGFLSNLMAPVLRALKVDTIEEGYMTALKSYYENLRREIFCEEYANQLQKLIDIINDYAESCLKPISQTGLQSIHGQVSAVLPDSRRSMLVVLLAF